MFSGEKQEITIKCKNELLDTIVDQFEKDLIFRKKGLTHFEVTVNNSIQGMKYWCLRNLESVDIVSPLSFKEEINDLLKSKIY